MKLLDWICTNCGFVGRKSDRGKSCCNKPKIIQMDKYYKEQMEKFRAGGSVSKYVVRLYDGFDNEWIDVCAPVSKAEATRIWNGKTKNGTEKTTFDDIDYYEIFPADTIMKFSREGRDLK